MPDPFSENVADLEASATLAVAVRARQLRAEGRDVIDLSAGEPDFATPDPISAAGVDAIRAGQTHYTPVPGLVALRQSIAGHLGRRSGQVIDAAGIVVANGAKQALFNVCFVLFGPGDRVLVPVPYWTSYPSILKLARAEPAFVPGDPANGFKVTPDDLESALAPSVRGLILNSPSNPTGAVYTRTELEAIVRWAAERGLWVIGDEIYGRLCYTAERAPGLLDLDPELLSLCVLVDGASKAYAMTGWRIGFSYSDPVVARAVTALQSHTTSNPNTPAQYAAMAAFAGEPDVERAVADMAAAFRRRRDLVLRLFDEHLPELSYVRPDGAFYLFFSTREVDRRAGGDSIAFCGWLLEEAGVALVPGAAFGDDGYARLSFATADATLEDGIHRLADALRPRLAAAGGFGDTE